MGDFETIAENLVLQENFTSLVVIEEDINYRGDRVSYVIHKPRFLGVFQ